MPKPSDGVQIGGVARPRIDETIPIPLTTSLIAATAAERTVSIWLVSCSVPEICLVSKIWNCLADP